jgi:arylsulfatase A-like enzyme
VLTGRHPNRYGCYIYGKPLRVQEMTVAQALKAVGYATGHFGKWHLNGVSGPGKLIPASDPLNPGRFGFDEWFSTSNFFETDWSFSHNGQTVQTAGDGSDAIMAQALKFMAKANSQGKPFLAVVWFGSPHLPHKPTDEYKAAAGGDAYCGEIYGIDHSMGTLRAELRKLGVAADTLVWYTSDNGATRGGSTGGLRGGKSTIFEGGLRVPCIIEWPARVTKPFATDVPAVTSDIYPTILDIVGYKAPNQVQPIDGISILPLIDGKMTQRPRPIGFVWSGNGKAKGQAAWTDNRYKLLKHAPDKYELYDLVADLVEAKDLAPEKPDIVAKMKAQLEAWLDSVENSDKGKDYQGGSR